MVSQKVFVLLLSSAFLLASCKPIKKGRNPGNTESEPEKDVKNEKSKKENPHKEILNPQKKCLPPFDYGTNYHTSCVHHVNDDSHLIGCNHGCCCHGYRSNPHGCCCGLNTGGTSGPLVAPLIHAGGGGYHAGGCGCHGDDHVIAVGCGDNHIAVGHRGHSGFPHHGVGCPDDYLHLPCQHHTGCSCNHDNPHHVMLSGCDSNHHWNYGCGGTGFPCAGTGHHGDVGIGLPFTSHCCEDNWGHPCNLNLCTGPCGTVLAPPQYTVSKGQEEADGGKDGGDKNGGDKDGGDKDGGDKDGGDKDGGDEADKKKEEGNEKKEEKKKENTKEAKTADDGPIGVKKSNVTKLEDEEDQDNEDYMGNLPKAKAKSTVAEESKEAENTLPESDEAVVGRPETERDEKAQKRLI